MTRSWDLIGWTIFGALTGYGIAVILMKLINLIDSMPPLPTDLFPFNILNKIWEWISAGLKIVGRAIIWILSGGKR